MHSYYCTFCQADHDNENACPLIFDESGLVVGEARPETEATDIDLDILDDDVLPTSGIVVEEYTDSISRNWFVMEYLKMVNHKHYWRTRQCLSTSL